jgi:50S ribosomal protein L16 3-hydroxylase
VHGWSEESYDMFLQKYLQRQPLLIRNALPNIDTLINLNAHDYYELMQDDDVESRLFLRKDGKTEKHYGPFTADYLQELPTRDWSILLQEVDRHIPKVSDLWDIGFNFIPSWRRDDIMISYSMPGGGIGGHVDNYDVFLLQGR